MHGHMNVKFIMYFRNSANYNSMTYFWSVSSVKHIVHWMFCGKNE